MSCNHCKIRLWAKIIQDEDNLSLRQWPHVTFNSFKGHIFHLEILSSWCSHFAKEYPWIKKYLLRSHEFTCVVSNLFYCWCDKSYNNTPTFHSMSYYLFSCFFLFFFNFFVSFYHGFMKKNNIHIWYKSFELINKASLKNSTRYFIFFLWSYL